jgi:hypothetical protein
LTLHIDPDPLEIDSRPCELCGLTIDRHHMVDRGDGPEFYCLESSALAARLLAGQFADTNGKPFALGFNTGIEYALKQIAAHDDIAILGGMIEPADAPPVAPTDPEPPPYRTPQATVDAFKFMVATEDSARVRDWLAARPKDAAFLIALLKSQISCK